MGGGVSEEEKERRKMLEGRGRRRGCGEGNKEVLQGTTEGP